MGSGLRMETEGTSISALAPRPRVTGVAVGVFDGVHLGHRAILGRILEQDGPEGAAALTFEPHPLAVVAPEKAPPRLTTAAQRERLIRVAGIPEVLTVRFDTALRQLSAEEFLAELKRIFPGLKRVAIGPNWRFGRGRSGDAATLNAYGAGHGFSTETIEAVHFQEKPISSTRVREAIAARNFAEAAEMLGREYLIEGIVAAGDGRGAGIGFPTANFGGIGQLLPPPGVYACRAELAGRMLRAVANYGSKPTFGPDGHPVLEVHLLDFSERIYGAALAVGAFRFLRDERKFESIDALKAQITADVAAARAVG